MDLLDFEEPAELQPENCRDLTLPISSFIYLLGEMREIIACEELFDYTLEDDGQPIVEDVTEEMWGRFHAVLNGIKAEITLSVPNVLADCFEEYLKPEREGW